MFLSTVGHAGKGAAMLVPFAPSAVAASTKLCCLWFCAVMVSISGVLPVLHGAVCLTLPAIGNLVSAMHHDGLVRAICICLCG